MQYGHKRFYEMTKEEEQLHSSKNFDYAGGGDPLGNFNRVAELVDKYNILSAPHSTRTKVAIIYQLKQFDCFMDAYGKGKKMKVEGFHSRIQDISVYAKLIDIMLEEDK
jgi:hypothetical protein